MASFCPLQSSGGVTTSNFDFAVLSIHPNMLCLFSYCPPGRSKCSQAGGLAMMRETVRKTFMMIIMLLIDDVDADDNDDESDDDNNDNEESNTDWFIEENTASERNCKACRWRPLKF